MKASRQFARRNIQAAGSFSSLSCLLAAALLISGCGKPASNASIPGAATAGPAEPSVPIAPAKEIVESVPPDPKTLAKITERFAKTPVRPLPQKADVSQSMNRWQTRADCWRRVFLDGFRAQNTGDDATRAPAEKFLEGYCLRISQSPDAPATEELLAQGERLFETGVRDPHVSQAFAAVLLDSKSDKSPRFAEVLKSLDGTIHNGKVSPWMTARFHRLKANVAKQADDASAWVEHMQGMIEDLLRASSDPRLTDIDRRMLVQLWSDWAGDFPTGPFRVEFTMKLDSTKDIDPWVHEILLARLYHTIAWEIRGTGPGGFLPQQFFDNMEHARRHALRAWEMKPELPEAATLMLKITMADKGAAGENVRFWFDEAVQADFTCLEAYHSLAWALRPRWRGNHKQMLAFGDECLATGRFDTEIPLMFHQMASGVVEERGSWWVLLEIPGVYERYNTLFETLAKNATNDTARNHLRAYLAAVAYLAGKEDRTRQILNELGSAVNPEDFAAFELSLDAIREDLGIK